MSTELLARDDVRALTEETAAIVADAGAFKIATNVSFQLAAEELKRIKGCAKKLGDLRKSMTQPLDAAKQAIMDFFRGPSEQLEVAEKTLKDAMSAYQKELERKAAEDRKRAEEARLQEQERLQVAAAKAAESGRTDHAMDLIQQAATVAAAPVAVRETPSVKGISFRETWRFEITDESLIPREYLIVDETKIRKVVLVMKEKTSIPGVRAYSDKQVAAVA